MSGIVFPDIAGTLAPILQLESADRRNALEESRQKKIDAEEERLNSAKQYVPGALAGDQDAFSKLAAIHPDMAIKLRGLADQKDAAKLARAKAGAEWLGGAAGGVLSAPPEEKPAAYQQYLADGKARGIDMSTMPQQYSPAVDSTLRYHLNSAVGASKVFEHLESQPQAMPPVGGAPAAPGGPTPDRQQFISMMTPHAQTVAQATGLDPRLVLAQSALETGYGAGAPGNNYFGIKGGNGPALNTTEAGPGGALVPAQAAFRTYADPGASAQDYANLLKGDPRYAPVLQAKGIDAQIDAMGKSGYATDPNYAAKLRQIVQGLPAPQMAQAGPPATGAPPGMPVGGDAAAGQPGTMPGAAPAVDTDAAMLLHVNNARERARVQGGDVFLDPKTHKPEEQDGQLVIRSLANPRQVLGYAPLPPKPQAPPAGYRATSGGLEFVPGGPADPARVQADKVPAGYRVKPDGSGTLEFVPGGPADPAIVKRASPMNNEQARDAGFSDRMMQAEGVLSTLDQEGTKFWERMSEKAPASVGGFVQSEDYQKFRQARDNFINAQLRRESGAAINADEYVKADKQYFPQPGDGPKVIEQKALNRKLAVEGMVRGAGPTYQPSPSVPAQKPQAGAPKPGTVEQGYVFRGGDPADKGNWSPAK